MSFFNRLKEAVPSFFTRWKESLAEFKHLQTVVFCGLMAALAVVLGYVASIEIGQYIRVGFSGLPNQVVSYLFGPAIGSIFGGALDVLKWAIKPTGPYFPGFTLSAFLAGLIYGGFFYKRPISVWRVFAAHALVTVIVNIGLNTYWLVLLYNRVASVILPARIVKNLIMLPIDTFITYVILKAVDRVIVPQLKHLRMQRIKG